MKLARMCSQAVDYPKNGVPVNIDDLPRYLIPFKPDWQAAEVANPHKTDYYESSRAIGHLYRAIQLQDVPPPSEAAIQPPLSDQISQRLLPLVRRTIEDYRDPDGRSPAVIKLFRQYVDEVQYISMTHTISQKDALREEEVVVGSIMAKCSQTRWRSDRITSMRVHVSELVGIMQRAIMPQRIEDATEEELKRGLTNAWAAWDYSARRKGEFGANSFGLVALGLIFDLLKKLDVELGYEI
jgi:RNA-dependent RNA polymerase